MQNFLEWGELVQAEKLLIYIKQTKNLELLENYINLVCSCKMKNTALHFAAKGGNRNRSRESYQRFKIFCIDVLESEEKLTSLKSVNSEGYNPDQYCNFLYPNPDSLKQKS